MSTGVLIALIICGTILAIISMVLVAAIIFQKRQQKMIEKTTKDFNKNFNFFKED